MTDTLTREDVVCAHGAYSESLATSCWNYGYTVARCMHNGFYADALRTMRSVRRILERCNTDARVYCLAEYMDGRRTKACTECGEVCVTVRERRDGRTTCDYCTPTSAF